ncbi:hypothetical protein A3K73_01540 [Candidatus Pacearchaeota archaeon RBG_13_36_9]|nr:MAG: hypothetical protein A3K73_01540 [Candidatus Pacearchaeota archaeon RBG_13_36_9]
MIKKIEKCVKCKKLVSEKELENNRGYKIGFEDLDISTKNQILEDSLILGKKPKEEYVICEECVEKLNKHGGESSLLD